MTTYSLKYFIGYPFESIPRPLFSYQHSWILCKYYAFHFICLFLSYSLFLAPSPGLILDLPVVFDFDYFVFEVASDVELPCFFTPPLLLFVIFVLPTLLFVVFLSKKLSMGFMPTSASTFFFSCNFFFRCLLIPPASDLPILALVLADSPCLVPTKNM